MTTTKTAAKKNTSGNTTATTARKKGATSRTTARKKKNTAEVVEAEIVDEHTYMSDVARQLAGNYDVEAREKELAPLIHAKISGTLASRDQTQFAKMAADVATIGQEHVDAAVSGKTDLLTRTSSVVATRSDSVKSMQRDLASLAVTVNDIGKESFVTRWLPFLTTPEKKILEYQARCKSAEKNLQDISDSLNKGAYNMERDADMLDQEAAYQRERMGDIAADVHAVHIIQAAAEARVAELRASGDKGDAMLADALKSSVVDAADARKNELLGQIGTSIYACHVLALTAQMARKEAGQARQTINNAIPTLKIQSIATVALGEQEMLNSAISAVNDKVKKQTEEINRLIGKNVQAMVDHEKENIARVEYIKNNLDTITGIIANAREQLASINEERKVNNKELTEFVAPLVDKLEARREIDGGSVNVL